jgi:DNA-binding response OmpR family regulator
MPSGIVRVELARRRARYKRALPLTFYACGKRARRFRCDFTVVNILLVEDHSDSREVLSGLLNHCGHEVITAATMQDALRLLDHLRFEALVCDIGLPDGSGLDLVVAAKKRQPWKKTIALTAHNQSEEMELGLRAGFDEYLTKPFDFHQLRSILAESRGTTNPPS